MAKEWRRVPLVSRIFLSMVCLQTIAYISIRALKFDKFSNCANISSRDQAWVLIVAVFLNVSVIYFAINGVIRQKITELYSFIFASFLQVIRAYFDYLNEGPDALMIADMVVCILAFLVYLPLCFFVSRAFGWTTFALAGGDDFKRRVLYWFFAFVTILKFRFLITVLVLLTFGVFLLSEWWQLLILIGITPAVMLVVCIKLIAKSKREDTQIVARSYLVQILILAGIIGVFVWAVQLPGVQKVNGLGLSGGFDYVGLNIYPNKCKPQQDWKSSTEIGSCPADSINIANSPNFEGCSDSVGIKMTSFVEKANSFSSYELLQDDSVYRCIDLEMSIKNGTLSENWRSKKVCTYDMDLARTTLMQTKTFFVRLFKCPGSSSVPNPYAGCFPVKRSVGLTFVIVMMVILIIIHLLEIFALVKLASLKGRGLEDMLRKRAISSRPEPIISDVASTPYYANFVAKSMGYN